MQHFRDPARHKAGGVFPSLMAAHPVSDYEEILFQAAPGTADVKRVFIVLSDEADIRKSRIA